MSVFWDYEPSLLDTLYTYPLSLSFIGNVKVLTVRYDVDISLSIRCLNDIYNDLPASRGPTFVMLAPGNSAINSERGPGSDWVHFIYMYVVNLNDTIRYLTFSMPYFFPIEYRYWYRVEYWYQSLLSDTHTLSLSQLIFFKMGGWSSRVLVFLYTLSLQAGLSLL